MRETPQMAIFQQPFLKKEVNLFFKYCLE